MAGQAKWPLVPPTTPAGGPFTDLQGMDLAKSLAPSLISVANDLRDLYTQFGLRPYEVRIVRTRWASGSRMEGVELLEDVKTILPTPRLVDMAGVAEVLTEAGIEELGDVVIDQINGSFTEDFLLGRDAASGDPPDPDTSVFYEIEFPHLDGTSGRKRRFNILGAPMYRADQFQWTVRLRKALGERSRDGRPGG